MAYLPYSQTIQALRGTGQALTGLAQLDAERKAAESTHGLNMARLGLQGEQMRGQQTLGLAQMEQSARQRAEDVGFRNKQFDAEQAIRDRQMAALDDAAKERARQMETGTVGSFWENKMIADNVPEQDRKRIVSQAQKALGPLWNLDTTRGQAEKVAFEEVPKYLLSEAEAQWRNDYARIMKGDSVGSRGKVGQMVESQMFKEMQNRHNSKLNLLNESGMFDDNSTAYKDLKQTIEKESNGMVTIMPMDLQYEDKNTGETRTKRGAGLTTTMAAAEVEVDNRIRNVVKKYPWLAPNNSDTMESLEKKKKYVSELIDPAIYGNDNAMRKYLAESGGALFTPNTVAPQQPIPKVPTSQASQQQLGGMTRTYSPQQAQVNAELMRPLQGVGGMIGNLYKFSRKPIDPSTGLPYK